MKKWNLFFLYWFFCSGYSASAFTLGYFSVVCGDNYEDQYFVIESDSPLIHGTYTKNYHLVDWLECASYLFKSGLSGNVYSDACKQFFFVRDISRTFEVYSSIQIPSTGKYNTVIKLRAVNLELPIGLFGLLPTDNSFLSVLKIDLPSTRILGNPNNFFFRVNPWLGIVPILGVLSGNYIFNYDYSLYYNDYVFRSFFGFLGCYYQECPKCTDYNIFNNYLQANGIVWENLSENYKQLIAARFMSEYNSLETFISLSVSEMDHYKRLPSNTCQEDINYSYRDVEFYPEAQNLETAAPAIFFPSIPAHQIESNPFTIETVRSSLPVKTTLVPLLSKVSQCLPSDITNTDDPTKANGWEFGLQVLDRSGSTLQDFVSGTTPGIPVGRFYFYIRYDDLFVNTPILNASILQSYFEGLSDNILVLESVPFDLPTDFSTSRHHFSLSWNGNTFSATINGTSYPLSMTNIPESELYTNDIKIKQALSAACIREGSFVLTNSLLSNVASSNSPSFLNTGKVSSIRVYSRLLSAQELSLNATQKDRPESNSSCLVLGSSMLTNESGKLIDYSQNANHGSVIGSINLGEVINVPTFEGRFCPPLPCPGVRPPQVIDECAVCNR